MVCNYCGKDLPDDSQFCLWCGRAQQAEQPPQPGYLSYSDSPQAIDNSKTAGFHVFSAAGRLNRLKYLYVLLMDIIGSLLCSAGFAYLFYLPGVSHVLLIVFYYTLIILLFVVRIIAMIKRFHDLNRPGTHIFMLLIPFYNIYIACLLLFAAAPAEINEFGRQEHNGHYWQVPLMMVLLPALFCISGAALAGSTDYGAFGIPFATTAPAPTATPVPVPLHYYNGLYQVSINFPAGWVQGDVQGYLESADASDYSGAMMLDVQPTNEVSFSSYTDDNFILMERSLMDKDKFSETFGYDNIETLFPPTDCYIGNLRFLKLEFYQTVESAIYRRIIFLGIYDSKMISIYLVAPSDATAAQINEMVASAMTFHMGYESVPTPTSTD